jgi:DNA-directed RNA polymerase subunit H (RpoH/RPB5)
MQEPIIIDATSMTEEELTEVLKKYGIDLDDAPQFEGMYGS